VGVTAFQSQSENISQTILQHLFSAIIMLLSTIAVLYVKNLYRNMEGEQLQMNALFEHANEGIILVNHKGEIVLINPAGENLFKYSKEEVYGKKIELLIPQRFHHNHDTYRNQYAQVPSNRRMGHGRELYAIKKNGKEFPVEISLSHYKLKNQFFVIAFIIDITQRKETEKRMLAQREELERVSNEVRQWNAQLENKVKDRTLILQEALHELEQSQQDLNEALNKEKELNEIKSRFVSMASHEFRTPLSSILSSASLLTRYTKSDEQENRNRHINRIKDAVKHLNDLLEDFLSLGRLEEGRISASAETFSLRDFLEEVIDEMRIHLKGQQELKVQCKGQPELVSDKKLLKNILINVISNAIKFSNETGTIVVETDNQLNNFRLSISDNGIGISEEDQQHLFSSFFRAKNATNIQGTGLGLHIVKRYADLLGGRISLKSILDEGTTVILDLPK
jgi:PAS domain S-box-containing protein